MRKSTPHLNDEHMRLYEWSGAGTHIDFPVKSKRTHPGHASYAVLAVLTNLLILSGCDSGATVEHVGAQVDQVVQEPAPDAAPPYEAAAPVSETAPDALPAQAGEGIEPLAAEPPK